MLRSGPEAAEVTPVGADAFGAGLFPVQPDNARAAIKAIVHFVVITVLFQLEKMSRQGWYGP
jgi:hypothetical protein